MIVKDESPLDIDDNKLLRSRLNEQSDLIMILKESADREMQRCRDYEFKLSLEQDKYFDVTQELEEAKHRLIQCQHQNAHLLKLVADMEKSKKVEKQSSGTQCFLCRKPETIDQGSNTASNHKETLEKLNRLRQERDNLDMENKQLKSDKTDLQNRLIQTEKENSSKQSNLLEKISKLEEQLGCSGEDCRRIQQEFEKFREEGEKERKEWRSKLMLSKKKQNELNDEVKLLKSTREALKEEVKDLKELRQREIDNYNVDKQIILLKIQLEEAEDRYRQLYEDFNAYKNYAKELLEAEKNINRQLRRTYHQR